MPWSHTEGKKWLNDEYCRLKPETVVDIGPGAGMYANWFRPMHKAHWTGVEVWEPYVAAYNLNQKYDNLILGDAREIELPEVDLYIAGDVLEHMPRNDAVALIKRMQAKCKHLFVSVPIVEYHQGALEGNPYEVHQYHWGFDEMHSLLGNCPSWQGEVIGAYHWTQLDDVVEVKSRAKKTVRKTASKKAA